MIIYDFRDNEYKNISSEKLNFIAPELWAYVYSGEHKGYRNRITYTDGMIQDVFITQDILDSSRVDFTTVTLESSDKSKIIESIKLYVILTEDGIVEVENNL